MFKMFIAIVLTAIFSFTNILGSSAQSCGDRRPYCKNMSSCHDALYYLEICGKKRLDRDSDGIPCEAVCGQKLTPQLKAMKEKLKLPEKTKLGLLSHKTPSFQCGLKKSCRVMTSCKEATFYYKNCSLKNLDKDKDGKPCNRLCK